VVFVLDQDTGGWKTWSVDDNDLKAAGPTIDETVRAAQAALRVRYRPQPGGLETLFNWSEPGTGPDGAVPGSQGKGSPSKLLFEVKAAPGAYRAVSEDQGLQFEVERLDDLAAAARAAVAARWPGARPPKEVIFTLRTQTSL
jgi:hypothetical protein